MLKGKAINGTISDLVAPKIANVKKTYSHHDTIKYIDISSINAEDHSVSQVTEYSVKNAPSRAQQCVKYGDLLVSTVRPINRNIAIVDKDLDNLVASTGFCVLRPNDGMLNYLLSIVLSDDFTNAMCDKANGGVYPAVNNGDVLNYQIHIPDDDLAKRASLVRQQADKSKFMRSKSQFIEMFGSMDTTPVGEYVLDSFPGEWGIEDTNGTGVKVIRTTNFTNSGKLNLTDVITREIEMKKVNKKRIMKYDTILERSGGTTDNPVGRVVLFEEDGLYLCNNFTQVLRFKDIDPRFAFYSLFYFYQTNKTAIRGMGNKTTGIQNLNMSKYLGIGIPNALVEQQKAFTAIAEQADKSKFELKQSIEAIDKVIKSLINENL